MPSFVRKRSLVVDSFVTSGSKGKKANPISKDSIRPKAPSIFNPRGAGILSSSSRRGAPGPVKKVGKSDVSPIASRKSPEVLEMEELLGRGIHAR